MTVTAREIVARALTVRNQIDDLVGPGGTGGLVERLLIEFGDYKGRIEFELMQEVDRVPEDERTRDAKREARTLLQAKLQRAIENEQRLTEIQNQAKEKAEFARREFLAFDVARREFETELVRLINKQTTLAETGTAYMSMLTAYETAVTYVAALRDLVGKIIPIVDETMYLYTNARINVRTFNLVVAVNRGERPPPCPPVPPNNEEIVTVPSLAGILDTSTVRLGPMPPRRNSAPGGGAPAPGVVLPTLRPIVPIALPGAPTIGIPEIIQQFAELFRPERFDSEGFRTGRGVCDGVNCFQVSEESKPADPADVCSDDNCRLAMRGAAAAQQQVTDAAEVLDQEQLSLRESHILASGGTVVEEIDPETRLPTGRRIVRMIDAAGNVVVIGDIRDIEIEADGTVNVVQRNSLGDVVMVEGSPQTSPRGDLSAVPMTEQVRDPATGELVTVLTEFGRAPQPVIDPRTGQPRRDSQGNAIVRTYTEQQDAIQEAFKNFNRARTDRVAFLKDNFQTRVNPETRRIEFTGTQTVDVVNPETGEVTREQVELTFSENDITASGTILMRGKDSRGNEIVAANLGGTISVLGEGGRTRIGNVLLEFDPQTRDFRQSTILDQVSNFNTRSLDERVGFLQSFKSLNQLDPTLAIQREILRAQSVSGGQGVGRDETGQLIGIGSNARNTRAAEIFLRNSLQSEEFQQFLQGLPAESRAAIRQQMEQFAGAFARGVPQVLAQEFEEREVRRTQEAAEKLDSVNNFVAEQVGERGLRRARTTDDIFNAAQAERSSLQTALEQATTPEERESIRRKLAKLDQRVNQDLLNIDLGRGPRRDLTFREFITETENTQQRLRQQLDRPDISEGEKAQIREQLTTLETGLRQVRDLAETRGLDSTVQNGINSLRLELRQVTAGERTEVPFGVLVSPQEVQDARQRMRDSLTFQIETSNILNQQAQSELNAAIPPERQEKLSAERQRRIEQLQTLVDRRVNQIGDRMGEVVDRRLELERQLAAEENPARRRQIQQQLQQNRGQEVSLSMEAARVSAYTGRDGALTASIMLESLITNSPEGLNTVVGQDAQGRPITLGRAVGLQLIHLHLAAEELDPATGRPPIDPNTGRPRQGRTQFAVEAAQEVRQHLLDQNPQARQTILQTYETRVSEQIRQNVYGDIDPTTGERRELTEGEQQRLDQLVADHMTTINENAIVQQALTNPAYISVLEETVGADRAREFYQASVLTRVTTNAQRFLERSTSLADQAALLREPNFLTDIASINNANFKNALAKRIIQSADAERMIGIRGPPPTPAQELRYQQERLAVLGQLSNGIAQLGTGEQFRQVLAIRQTIATQGQEAFGQARQAFFSNQQRLEDPTLSDAERRRFQRETEELRQGLADFVHALPAEQSRGIIEQLDQSARMRPGERAYRRDAEGQTVRDRQGNLIEMFDPNERQAEFNRGLEDARLLADLNRGTADEAQYRELAQNYAVELFDEARFGRISPTGRPLPQQIEQFRNNIVNVASEHCASLGREACTQQLQGLRERIRMGTASLSANLRARAEVGEFGDFAERSQIDESIALNKFDQELSIALETATAQTLYRQARYVQDRADTVFRQTLEANRDRPNAQDLAIRARRQVFQEVGVTPEELGQLGVEIARTNEVASQHEDLLRAEQQMRANTFSGRVEQFGRPMVEGFSIAGDGSRPFLERMVGGMGGAFNALVNVQMGFGIAILKDTVGLLNEGFETATGIPGFRGIRTPSGLNQNIVRDTQQAVNNRRELMQQALAPGLDLRQQEERLRELVRTSPRVRVTPDQPTAREIYEQNMEFFETEVFGLNHEESYNEMMRNVAAERERRQQLQEDFDNRFTGANPMGQLKRAASYLPGPLRTIAGLGIFSQDVNRAAVLRDHISEGDQNTRALTEAANSMRQSGVSSITQLSNVLGAERYQDLVDRVGQSTQGRVQLLFENWGLQAGEMPQDETGRRMLQSQLAGIYIDEAMQAHERYDVQGVGQAMAQAARYDPELVSRTLPPEFLRNFERSVQMGSTLSEIGDFAGNMLVFGELAKAIGPIAQQVSSAVRSLSGRASTTVQMVRTLTNQLDDLASSVRSAERLGRMEQTLGRITGKPLGTLGRVSRQLDDVLAQARQPGVTPTQLRNLVRQAEGIIQREAGIQNLLPRATQQFKPPDLGVIDPGEVFEETGEVS